MTGADQASSGHIRFTQRAKTVLELSLRESRALSDLYIGTEHGLLGLIREGDGVAAHVLLELGADLERTREQVTRLLEERRREHGHQAGWTTSGNSRVAWDSSTNPPGATPARS